MGDHFDKCEGHSGIIEYPNLKKAGTICYGVKPPPNTEGVLEFR